MITFGEKLGNPECPYIKRWVIDFGPFSIRLHHWISSDDQRNFHDHPWWYLTLVLKGGYVDRNPQGSKRRTIGSLDFYPATHQHTVLVDPKGCWTLLITGRESRTWGFWVKGKFRKRNKYFFEHGHHPCDIKDQESSVGKLT